MPFCFILVFESISAVSTFVLFFLLMDTAQGISIVLRVLQKHVPTLVLLASQISSAFWGSIHTYRLLGVWAMCCVSHDQRYLTVFEKSSRVDSQKIVIGGDLS